MSEEKVSEYIKEIIEKTIFEERKLELGAENKVNLEKAEIDILEDYITKRRESIWEKAHQYTKVRTEDLY